MYSRLTDVFYINKVVYEPCQDGGIGLVSGQFGVSHLAFDR